MGRFLQCPLPSNSNPPQHFDQLQFNQNSDSSTNTSLASQPSLPSVPSLTPSPESADATVHHHCSATLKGHSSNVFSLALAGKNLLSGASAGEIRVWDRGPSPQSSSQVDNTAADGGSSVKSIAVLADRVFTAHHDHKIRVWKIDNSITPVPHQKYKLISTLPTISDRCLRLLLPNSYVKVRRHKKSTWIHHVDAVSALALTGDGSLLYSVSWDRTLKVWRTSDYKCLESVQNAHDDAINAIVLSGDGLVYTGSADKRIRVWRKNDRDKKHSLASTLEKHKSSVNALALSSDGSVLYSGACDRSIIVWAKEDGGGGGDMAVVGALRGHRKAILCLAVVKDMLCSGSADRTVRVWGRGSGNSYSCLAVLEGHTSPVKCLAAGLDSNNHGKKDCGDSYLVYSGSLDSELKVWQISVPSNHGQFR